MRLKLRVTLLLAVLGVSASCSAALVTILSPDSVAKPAQHEPPESETAQIRRVHLKRLDDRLTIPHNDLKAQCRYESDISTAPPAKHVVLTFDDGPDATQTEFILETLGKYKINATFFMIGDKMERHPELVAKVRAAGNQVIGNHSWNHPNFHDISPSEQITEIDKVETVGIDTAPLKVFRYPYGNSTCEANDYLHRHGYRIVGWHVDTCDWAFDKTGEVDVKEAISCEVLPQYRDNFAGHVVSSVRAHNGGIVLMHEIHPNTLKKLDEIITTLIADGFVFGSIEDTDFQNDLR